MNLTFRNDSKNSRQLVIIENSYKDKDVDTEKYMKKVFLVKIITQE